VRAVLASDTGPVTVFGTHLDNPGGAESARQAQVQQLLTFWGGAGPALIAGDFNADRDSVAMVALAGAGLIDTGADLEPDATTSHDERRIEYILVTSGITIIRAEIPQVWASDHRPFIARLSFGP
jgi:endonuclease/exonuclease/phosphatase (EEP) superfamily protein YafD